MSLCSYSYGALLGSPLGSQKREEQVKEDKRVEEKKRLTFLLINFFFVYFGEKSA